MSELTSAVRNWLDDNGYGDLEGMRVSVMAGTGGTCRIVMEGANLKCARCVTKGPTLMSRLTGACSACERIGAEHSTRLNILARDLVPVLGEAFLLFRNEDMDNRRWGDWQGFDNNGAILSIYIKGKNE